MQWIAKSWSTHSTLVVVVVVLRSVIKLNGPTMSCKSASQNGVGGTVVGPSNGGVLSSSSFRIVG